MMSYNNFNRSNAAPRDYEWEARLGSHGMNAGGPWMGEGGQRVCYVYPGGDPSKRWVALVGDDPRKFNPAFPTFYQGYMIDRSGRPTTPMMAPLYAPVMAGIPAPVQTLTQTPRCNAPTLKGTPCQRDHGCNIATHVAFHNNRNVAVNANMQLPTQPPVNSELVTQMPF